MQITSDRGCRQASPPDAGLASRLAEVQALARRYGDEPWTSLKILVNEGFIGDHMCQTRSAAPALNLSELRLS